MPRQLPRVVVAEDDDLIRSSITSALRAEGCVVAVSRNGAALGAQLGVMMAVSDTPALIIADDRMPGLSGLAALERARSWGWSIPMVLITAFADDVLIQRANALGAHVLAKPFDLAALRALARVMLSGKAPRCAYCGSTFDLRPVAAAATDFLCGHCRAWWDEEATDPLGRVP